MPGAYLIELHSPGVHGQTMSVNEAVDRMYLGPDRFYRVIDVAMKKLVAGKCVAFVRVSGHPPVGFDQTWDATELGPFKQMIPEHIGDQGVPAS
jgi:hypothetical protein